MSDPDLANAFTCASIVHPSITLEERIFGSDTNELVKNIQKPLLLFPTRGDPDEYRKGGAIFEPLKYRLSSSEVVDMPHLDHGFLPRGDIRKPEVFEGVKYAMDKTLEFFHEHNKG